MSQPDVAAAAPANKKKKRCVTEYRMLAGLISSLSTEFSSCKDELSSTLENLEGADEECVLADAAEFMEELTGYSDRLRKLTKRLKTANADLNEFITSVITTTNPPTSNSDF